MYGQISLLITQFQLRSDYPGARRTTATGVPPTLSRNQLFPGTNDVGGLAYAESIENSPGNWKDLLHDAKGLDEA